MKIKRTQLAQTNVNIYKQIESASSRMTLCLSQCNIFDIDARRPKLSLFKNKYIIIGIIMSAIDIMAITPHEFLIKEREEEIVFKASLTDAPTKGVKLLMAKRAVFKVIVSTLSEIVFFNEKINIKIDIIKTVTDVNVVLTSFEIPLNSMPPIALIQLNIRDKLTSGSINTSKKPSTKEINKTMEEFDTVADDIFPLTSCKLIIIGAKALITLQMILK